MTALVVDGNDFSRALTRNILGGFRFREILTTATPRAAIAALNARAVDVVITEWYLGAISGATFVQKIRTLNIIRDNQLPVIVVTAGAQAETVCGARDAGATDFVSRPLVLYTFLPRITQAIATPRSFIQSAGYTGPDRRRKQLPIPFEDRRNRLSVDGIIDRSPLVASLEQRVRQPGGLTIPELAANGEKIIANEAKRYANVCSQDIREIATAVRALRTPGCDVTAVVDQIVFRSHGLSGMAETFGFPLLSAVGASLCSMLRSLPVERPFDAVVLDGIESHAMAMKAVATNNIRDDGGKIGAELISGLGAITEKICPSSARS